jgi:predicted RNA-binding Zn-ribbon protein involved in translation (DUF1610 family)
LEAAFGTGDAQADDAHTRCRPRMRRPQAARLVGPRAPRRLSLLQREGAISFYRAAAHAVVANRDKDETNPRRGLLEPSRTSVDYLECPACGARYLARDRRGRERPRDKPRWFYCYRCKKRVESAPPLGDEPVSNLA